MNENMKKQMSRAIWLISVLMSGPSLIGVGQVFAQDQVQTQGKRPAVPSCFSIFTCS
jgi:hypothetical protein